MSRSTLTAFFVQAVGSSQLPGDTEGHLTNYMRTNVQARVLPNSVVLKPGSKKIAYFELQDPLTGVEKLNYIASTVKLMGASIMFTSTSPVMEVELSGVLPKHANEEMMELVLDNQLDWTLDEEYKFVQVDKDARTVLIKLTRSEYIPTILTSTISIGKTQLATKKYIKWEDVSLSQPANEPAQHQHNPGKGPRSSHEQPNPVQRVGGHHPHTTRKPTEKPIPSARKRVSPAPDQPKPPGLPVKPCFGPVRSNSTATSTAPFRPQPMTRQKPIQSSPQPSPSGDISSEDDSFEEANTEHSTRPLPEGKYQLAKLLLKGQTNKAISVIPRDSERKITFRGLEEVIKKEIQGLYSRLSKAYEAPLQLHSSVTELLNSDSGLALFHNQLENAQIKGVLYKKSEQMYGMCESQKGMKSMKDLIERMFKTKTFPLNREIAEYSSTEDWREKIDQIKGKCMMSVTLSDGHVVLCARKEDFHKAADRLGAFLQLDIPRCCSISLPKMEWLLLKNYLEDRVREVLAEAGGRYHGVNYNYKGNESASMGHELVLSATGDAVYEMKKKIEQEIIKDMAYGSLDLKSDGMTKRAIEKSKHYLLNPVEQSYKCLIQVEETSSSSESDLLTTEGLLGGNKTSNGVNIEIVKGDIARFQADMLVNPVTGNDTTFSKMGAVCSSFRTVGGPMLAQSYVAAGGPVKEGEVIVTDKCGSLVCRYIAHAGIRSARPGHEAKLKSLILSCLEQAKQHKCRSIAFNTIGCGNMKYSEDDVISAFKSATAMIPGSLLVYIVAFDVQTQERFLQSLLQAEHRQFEPADDRRLNSMDFARDENSKLQLRILAENKAALQRAKAQLEKNLAVLSTSESVPFEYARFITARQKKRVEGLSCDEVVVFVGAHGVEMTGEERAVRAMKYKVEEHLKSIEEEIWSPKAASEDQRDEEFLDYLQKKQHTFPKYWNTQGVLRDKELNDSASSKLNAQTAEYKDIAQIVSNAGNVNVKSILRLEIVNPYSQYVDALKVMCRKGVRQSVLDITGSEVKTTVVSNTLNERLVHQVNEHYLLRGAKLTSAGKPIQPDFRNAEGDFGKGLHFTESIIEGSDSHVFVARVLLGTISSVTEKTKNKRPVCTVCLKDPCTSNHNKPSDSILGTEPAGRKFVLFENQQFYTEYLVEFSR